MMMLIIYKFISDFGKATRSINLNLIEGLVI